MQIITTNEKLAEFAKEAEQEKFIILDTEFMRNKTYYAILCLIQVATTKSLYIIDALAEGINLEILHDIFVNPNIVKIFHSGRQDIEILEKLYGKMPVGLFDSQIAAKICGFGEALSYDRLVAKLLDITIDKTQQYTDWAKRPLTEQQIIYAFNDVLYLREIYPKLQLMLEESDRKVKFEQEMAKAFNLAIKKDPADKIKLKNKSKKVVNLAKALARWRDEQARKLNIPKNHLLHSQTLINIACKSPTTAKQVTRIYKNASKEIAEELALFIANHIANGLEEESNKIKL